MIPEKVKVAGLEYKVQEVDDFIFDHSLGGQIIYPKGLIKIDGGMSQTKKEQVFIHELFHAVLDAAGYDDQDEDMVNRVSIVLYQVLKDNQISFNKD